MAAALSRDVNPGPTYAAALLIFSPRLVLTNSPPLSPSEERGSSPPRTSVVAIYAGDGPVRRRRTSWSEAIQPGLQSNGLSAQEWRSYPIQKHKSTRHTDFSLPTPTTDHRPPSPFSQPTTHNSPKDTMSTRNQKPFRNPHDLPTKICAVCGRPFVWRKKWARDWDAVRYCSERCRRQGSGGASTTETEKTPR